MPESDSPITVKVPWPKFMLTPAYQAMQKTLNSFGYKLVVQPSPSAGQEPIAYIVNVKQASSPPPANAA